MCLWGQNFSVYKCATFVNGRVKEIYLEVGVRGAYGPVADAHDKNNTASFVHHL